MIKTATTAAIKGEVKEIARWNCPVLSARAEAKAGRIALLQSRPSAKLHGEMSERRRLGLGL